MLTSIRCYKKAINMNIERDVLILPKENPDLTNIIRKGKNLNAPGNTSSIELDVLRRCNSLPIFISNNMYCDWKKKSTNNVQSWFITRASNRQSIYLTDSSTFNFDPFNIENETKSLQELQTEVNALIEFRNIVIETFPDLKKKMMSMRSTVLSQRNQSKTKRIRRKSLASINAQENSVIYQGEAIGETLPSFVSRSRSNSNCCRKEPKSGEGSGSTIQDSGFSTETNSSKDGSSAPASSSGLQATNIYNRLLSDSDDELLNLLDVISRKTLRFREKFPFMPHFEFDKNETHVSSARIPNILKSSILHTKVLRLNKNYPLKQNLHRLNKERDKLLLKVAELESEIIKNRIKISKMETKLEFLTSGNKSLEEQLKAALNQNQELNFKLFQGKCDSASRKYAWPPPTGVVKRQRETCVKRQCSKLVTRNISGRTGQKSSNTISENSPDENGSSQQSTTCDRLTSELNINSEKLEITNKKKGMHSSTNKLNPDFGYKSNTNDIQSFGRLGRILSSTDSNKIAAILLETNPLELQRHLLTLTIEKQGKRSISKQLGPKSIPLVIKNKPQKLLLHQMGNTSNYSYDCDDSCSLEPLTNDENLKYEHVDPVKEENSIDSLRDHGSKIQNECEKNIQLGKRLKPSKIPLFGSKTLHSSKAIHKSLSLSTGTVYLKNSKLNQQDELISKTQGYLSSVAVGPKVVSGHSVLLKTNRDLETERFLPLNSLVKSNKNLKTNEYIQTDTKTGPSTKLIIQNKYSNPLITFPSRRDTDSKVNTMFESTERHSSRKDAKTKTDAENNIGYLTQPGVELLLGGITIGSNKHSVTNSSNNNSMAEDEPFTDEHIGRVRNLRSTLLGWFKI